MIFLPCFTLVLNYIILPLTSFLFLSLKYFRLAFDKHVPLIPKALTLSALVLPGLMLTPSFKRELLAAERKFCKELSRVCNRICSSLAYCTSMQTNLAHLTSVRENYFLNLFSLFLRIKKNLCIPFKVLSNLSAPQAPELYTKLSPE